VLRDTDLQLRATIQQTIFTAEKPSA
jgi:hypothetical protein